MSERFDANLYWDEDTVCNECKVEDSREDHDGACDCYCHHVAHIKFLESRFRSLEERNRGLVSALEDIYEEVRWITEPTNPEAQTKSIAEVALAHAELALAPYKKLTGDSKWK